MASLYLLLILTPEMTATRSFSLNTCTHGVPSTPALSATSPSRSTSISTKCTLSTYSSTTRAMIGRSLPQGPQPTAE